MPLHETSGPVDPASLLHAPEQFLIFYSSRDEEGKLWCPDCRDVERLIRDEFDKDSGPTGLIVYVGQKPEWKTPSNRFRGDPWKIHSIPTIIKKHEGKELGRLVEAEIEAKLPAFIGRPAA
ncbi:hypothetical protein GLOTRDRAFT_31613 [Gloeophyllum trabeum ATCC 11539]|uniref:Thioredoxin domain-containing protein n=1 Tax=Gloeophyllum trabeum (strain ATCC 11539 / FP-39264 / Madison 617) TaxID=670483 RepID=S7QLJ5_GLOTA|nr:uncharacterized protein GLOTRDRAFT_31613 [Gloeophyllum trabeum ATCC 11539]EPQ60253.1 hypothetical protein GLOTRDRAFT_31613 [Gloeophyllum trabeum ATCC 11539]